MRVTKITVRSVRGFRAPRTFDIGEHLTIIYGSNGGGKSSLCEAWDWVYTNETIADAMEPRNELKQGFKNLHATDPPFCNVELSNGTSQFHIQREGDTGGSLAHDLPAPPPGVSPVVLQYRLQAAVYSSDGDRAKFFTTVLGLRSAHDLVKRLEALGRAAEKEGSSASEKWRTVADQAPKLGFAMAHATPTSRADVDENEQMLTKLLAGILDCDPTEAAVVTGIKTKAAAPAGAPVTLDRLVPPELLSPQAKETLLAGAKALQDIIAIDRDSAHHSTWLAAGLRSAQPPACPFCGEHTLTPERLEQVRQRERTAADAAATLAASEDAIRRARALLTAAGPAAVDRIGTDLARLLEAAAEVPPEKRSVIEGPVGHARAALETWKKVPPEATETVRFGAAVDLVDAMQDLHDAAGGIKAALDDRLRPLEIAKLQMAALFYYEEPQRETWKRALDDGALLREAAKAAKDEFDHLLQDNADAVRDDIIRWYRVLRPHDSTPLAGLAIETGSSLKVRLHAETHGAQGHASAIFSHSNVNALGMACHLARLRKAGHRTVVLDDPTQALDPKNRATFERDFVKALLDEGMQVVLLTHDALTARSLLDEYQDYDPIGYAFETHAKDGPVVAPLYGDADHLVRRALDALESGDDTRVEAAALAVRKLTEQAIAEYLRSHGVVLPERATLGRLLALLDGLGAGKTPPAQVMKRLRDLEAHISAPLHHPVTLKPLTLGEIAGDLMEVLDLRRQPLQFAGSKTWPVNEGIKTRIATLAAW